MNLFLTKQNKANTIILFGLLCLLTLLCISLIKNGHITKFDQLTRDKLVSNSHINRTKKILYGSNIDISQLLPTSPYYVQDGHGKDLIDTAHTLGITLLRISSVLRSFPDQKPDVIYTKEQWDQVLDKMHRNGIKAMIIAETNTTNKNISSDDISQDYLDQMKKYIIDSGVGDNPDVYMIDMKNEPILNDHNLTMLKQEANLIKQRYPNILVTVGGWRVDTGTKDGQGKAIYRWNEPQDAILLSGTVDVYSPHIYNFDRKSKSGFPNPTTIITTYLDQLEKTVQGKGILIGEFGASNGDSLSDQDLIGSKELQANAYYAVYQALNDSKYTNILGSTSYVLYSRNQFPESFAIVKDKGDYIYPAGYVLQLFSLGKSDVNISMPFSEIPDDITLTTSNFHTITDANVGDIVLLELKGSKSNTLSKDNTYQLVITPTQDLKTVQKLTFTSQFNAFTAIFTVTKPGPIHLAFNQTPTCAVQHLCTQPSYTVYSTDLIAH